jgi:peptide/nickel transport system ATP-binding protein
MKKRFTTESILLPPASAKARVRARAEKKLLRQLERQNNRKHTPLGDYQTQMKNPEHVLEIDQLQSWFWTDAGILKAVDGVSFSVSKGQTVCLAGESGCGKSVLGLSLMRLLPRPQGQIVGGAIRLDTGAYVCDVVHAPERALEQIRGNAIAMIVQEPATSLNPVFRVGEQMLEPIRLHQPELTPAEGRARVLELLEQVGIADGEGAFAQYPHTLSGGMRQRVMIAMALACNPKLLLADEPTTALDATIQAQILDLLRELQQKTGVSILLMTHDLGVAAELADWVVILYAGRVVEQGTADDVLRHPAHPYTVGLIESNRLAGRERGKLSSIPGAVPEVIDRPDRCYFYERCTLRLPVCASGYPDEVCVSPLHTASCYRCGTGGEPQ